LICVQWDVQLTSHLMDADLGHFSRSSIQASFIFVCWPCLILTYLGQVGLCSLTRLHLTIHDNMKIQYTAL